MDKDTERRYSEMFDKIALKDGKEFDESYDGIFPPSVNYGMKKFKRECMGRLRTKTRKSLDELAIIFSNLGMADTIEVAKSILPNLSSFIGIYSCTQISASNVLEIVKDSKEKDKYLIKVYPVD